jgi:hypothetical protein
MFARDRKEAIRRAFKKAFAARGVDLKDSDLVTDMDEANAGAFNYIYTALLDEFRKFPQLTEKEYELLSYDFGGGTIDISLVAVKITRDQAARIKIQTELKGLSGDAFMGGDNVTLQVLNMLKMKCALALAERRIKDIEKKREEEARAKKKSTSFDNIWSTQPKEDTGDDMFFVDTKTTKPEQKKEVVVEEVDPELESVVNRENPTVYENAIQAIIVDKELILYAIENGTTVMEAALKVEKGGRDQAERRGKMCDLNLETLIPTRFANYQNVDPFKEDLSRKLFYELWNEADTLKVRMSQSEGRPCLVESVLRKIAKYGGVDPVCFNEVALELQHLDKRIDARITETVMKAFRLYQNSRPTAKRGIITANRGGKPEELNLRILLFGNSSNLPIVRKKFLEIFKVDPSSVVFERQTCKTSVAAGACEEYNLRKTMGSKNALIQFEPVGFLDKLPFAIGVYHPDLRLVGFETGFWPLFDRGTAIGTKLVVSEKTNFLVHPELTELAVYVDNKDGAQPVQVGYIDFRNPTGNVTVDPSKLGEDPNAGAFRIELELLPTREVQATNLQTGQTFGMVMDKALLKPEDNPFSGIF